MAVSASPESTTNIYTNISGTFNSKLTRQCSPGSPERRLALYVKFFGCRLPRVPTLEHLVLCRPLGAGAPSSTYENRYLGLLYQHFHILCLIDVVVF
mmetsp:Transcript_46235/g.122612  ORF Transcript_46235/g.122612 Transcript_46235/m.122612 type:complete len:97 (-) Transcript_46235:138-428(-)